LSVNIFSSGLISADSVSLQTWSSEMAVLTSNKCEATLYTGCKIIEMMLSFWGVLQ